MKEAFDVMCYLCEFLTAAVGYWFPVILHRPITRSSRR